MNYYYADENNQPVGPISEDQLHELHRAGSITLDSFVIAEGETEWKVYRTIGLPSPLVSNPLPLAPIIQNQYKSNLKCTMGFHDWNGCKCSKCGKLRDDGHDWSKDCEKCAKCGKISAVAHEWKGCKCLNCSQMRDDWWSAIDEGHVDIVRRLLARGISASGIDDCEATPLFRASEHGQVEVVKLLLQAGVDVNAGVDRYNQTPLFQAATKGHFDVVKLLVLAGADVNATNTAGRTPLMIATALGRNRDVIRFLEDVRGIRKVLYFEQERPFGDGLCSWDPCPCGGVGDRISRGTGYLYIPQSAVDFRADCLTLCDLTEKLDLMASRLRSGDRLLLANVPVLVCEQGIRKLAADKGVVVAIAKADAAHWWSTGLVPLRRTPEAI